MKILSLLRHGQTKSGDMHRGDIARELSVNGRKSITAIGQFMQSRDVSPDFALISGATRTKQSFALLAPFFPQKPEQKISRTLYQASAQRIINQINEIEKVYCSVLLVGHNPGIYELGLRLCGSVITHFAPATLCVVALDTVHWRDWWGAEARLLHFVNCETIMHEPCKH